MNNWQYHDRKMIELQRLYKKTSIQTQNRLQELLDTFNFKYDKLYNIADNQIKRRIDTYIETWKEQGLLTGYFGTLAKSIYSRTRVKNSEILELLIYSAYVEEQSRLQENELNMFKEDANYYYQQGQKEVNDTLKTKKKTSVISDAIFLALMDMPNYSGFSWKQYIETILQYNAQQIYKQVIIDIQQQKELEINSSEYQNIINNQIRQKININNGKISGATDLQLIGLNNLAKAEGIKSIDNNAKVRFVAITDENSTDMCQSMNNMEFYIDKENEFDRYWGETKKELKLVRVRVNGLVLGINLPPIMHHWHWCRSWIMYLPVENNVEAEYNNLDIPRINKEVKRILGNTKLNSNIKKLFNKYLTKDNTEIDNNLKVPMQYNKGKDKIIINPNHKDFKQYNLQEALTHEIVHMIDTRNKLLVNNKNLHSNIRSAGIEVNTNIEKYQEIFKNDEYFYDLCSGDTVGLLTGNKVKTFYYHPIGYTNIDEDIVANIETAYLTDNKIALKLFESNDVLKRLKDKVVKMYDKYTR